MELYLPIHIRRYILILPCFITVIKYVMFLSCHSTVTAADFDIFFTRVTFSRSWVHWPHNHQSCVYCRQCPACSWHREGRWISSYHATKIIQFFYSQNCSPCTLDHRSEFCHINLHIVSRITYQLVLWIF
jgi:hypothetical protein